MDFPFGVRVLIVCLLVAGVGGLLWVRLQPHPAPRAIATPSPPALTLLGVATAPTPLPAVSSTPHPKRRGPVSPFEISRYLKEHRNGWDFSMTEFWQRLGIDKGFVTWQGCDVDFFRLPLDSEAGNEVILRLFSPGLCRYLIFKPLSKNGRRYWKFLGVIDKGQHMQPSQHRLVATASQRWLVVTYEAGRGSGYGRGYQDWYTVTSKGIKTVLRYPSDRYFRGWSSGLEAKSDSTILKIQEEAGLATISLRFAISYSTYLWEDGKDKQIKLWQRSQLASFKQTPNSKKFVFDGAHSQLTKREMTALYDGLFTSCDDVLRYNYLQLVRITRDKPLAVKEWLKKYLHDCGDAPRKKALLRRLRKVRSVLDEQ